jgi:hypothetical protein
MRRFAFSYYVGTLILVFFLYVSFLRAVATELDQFLAGAVAGALAIIAILIAIHQAWKAK